MPLIDFLQFGPTWFHKRDTSHMGKASGVRSYKEGQLINGRRYREPLIVCGGGWPQQAPSLSL